MEEWMCYIVRIRQLFFLVTRLEIQGISPDKRGFI